MTKTTRHPSLVCAPSRSLKSLSAGPALLRLCLRISLTLLACAVVGGTHIQAQEVSDTVRVNTRVVFLDAIVKDKRTGVPLADLTAENFEVLDEGKPRPLSYFIRQDEARKPLALVLVLDLREDGAGRFLKRPEILDLMAAELAKLPSQDEVAIMVINYGEDEDRKLLTDFTNDRARIAAALKKVPALVGTDENEIQTQIKAAGPDKPDTEENSGRISVSSAAKSEPAENTGASAAKTEDKTPDQDVLSVETYKDPKTGATITRTIMKDGNVSSRRTSKNGKVDVATGAEYSLYAAAREVSKISIEQRPNSRAAIVWVTDGIIPIIFEDRNATEELLIRSNVTFNSLTVSMRTLYRFLLPLAKPVGNWIGMSFSGSARYLARQSGGEAVSISRSSDYARGLNKIIGNLSARYSLGFSLDELEQDDGRLHNLEVRVKAVDGKGKNRKLEVSARRGYYKSTVAPKEATASKTQ
jgi:VWFA-related protein